MKAKVLSKILIDTPFGPSHFVSFEGLADGLEHIAIILGNPEINNGVNVRIHSECLTGDVFGSTRCDCGDQLNESLARFGRSSGIVLYLRQEGRGIGLYNKLKAYELQSQGMDTFQANRQLGFEDDLRNFDVAAQMLAALGIAKIRLYSNNPDKAAVLEKNGIKVQCRVPTGTFLNKGNEGYLLAKKIQKGHDLNLSVLNIEVEKVS